MATNFVMPVQLHNELVAAAYRKRGFTPEEADAGARFSELTAWHGIKTHNAIKALHLDELFGSKAGGCKPGAHIQKLPSKFKAVEKWNAAKKGYIAYTCCTAALAEVVPFGGKFPTLGTNPHSWGFPTTDEIGYPICIDWATSTVAMGRVQQFAREG